MVNPTEAIASTAAVTSPNPNEASSRFTAASPRQCPQLLRCQLPDDLDLAGRVVGVHLEQAGGVVEAVEVGRATGSDVPDGLAGFERRDALGERGHHGGTGHPVADLLDERPEHRGTGALRLDH